MALTGLYNQGRTRRQQTGGLADQRAVGVQAVGTAIERGPRVIFPDLDRQATDIRRADIGWIRDDQIEQAGQSGRVIAGDERRAIREPRADGIGGGGLWDEQDGL